MEVRLVHGKCIELVHAEEVDSVDKSCRADYNYLC